MSARGDWRKLRQEIIARGYTVELAGRGNHYHVRTAEGKYVSSLSVSPSDHRAYVKAVAQLRRAGVLAVKTPWKRDDGRR